MKQVRRLLASALIVLASLIARDAEAQSFAVRTAAGRDSLATHVAYVAILGELTSHLARNLHDTASSPWDLTFPADSNGIAWSEIRRALTSLLHARARKDGDSTRSHLNVSGVHYSADSLRFDFDVGFYRRCANAKEWEGSHTTFRLEVEWERLTWPYRATSREHGDMLPCALRRRP